MLSPMESASLSTNDILDKQRLTEQDSASVGRELSPSQSSEGYASSGGLPDAQVPVEPGSSPSTPQAISDAALYTPVYDSSQYLLPITWGAVAGTLIWRGKVRSQWCKQGYDYDTFRLLARMKGSPIRVALLTSVSRSARTRAELAADLDVDWKTIDNHIEVLSKNGLVQEIGAFGTSRYFAVTERGRRVLSLLLSLDSESAADNIAPYPARTTQQADSEQPFNGHMN